MKKLLPVALLAATLYLLTGCGNVKLRNITMFKDIGNETMSIDSIPQLRVMPLDIISIQVSSNDPASVAVFQQQRSAMSGSGAASGEGAMGVQDGYRVDSYGNIDLPFIGQVRAQGRTLNELRVEITERLNKFILNTSVQLRFMNFRITLMGEVIRPNTYTVPNERLTILEAIGMAGDFTPYADRARVLVIREREGRREFARVNTQSRSLFRSPYFYLKPNDILYIEPLKAKQYATQGDFLERYATLFVSVLSVLVIYFSTIR